MMSNVFSAQHSFLEELKCRNLETITCLEKMHVGDKLNLKEEMLWPNCKGGGCPHSYSKYHLEEGKNENYHLHLLLSSWILDAQFCSSRITPQKWMVLAGHSEQQERMAANRTRMLFNSNKNKLGNSILSAPIKWIRCK